MSKLTATHASSLKGSITAPSGRSMSGLREYTRTLPDRREQVPLKRGASELGADADTTPWLEKSDCEGHGKVWSSDSEFWTASLSVMALDFESGRDIFAWLLFSVILSVRKVSASTMTTGTVQVEPIVVELWLHSTIFQESSSWPISGSAAERIEVIMLALVQVWNFYQS